MPETTTEAELAELAITVYIQELATDKRVLYVGDPQSRGPERLARVARSVELVSPHARARGTRRGSRVHSRRWPGEDDHARWDVVVVPDVDAAGLSEEHQIDQVGAWLARGGVLVAGTGGTDRGLTYEGLFDLLQVNFDSVRMIGQAPFRGFSLVDFAPPGDFGVTFDGSLLEGTDEQAQRFVALCGDEDVVLDAFAVVQVPSSSSAGRPASGGRSEPRDRGRVSQLNERLREQQDALDAANVHSEELERELGSVRGSLGDAKSDLATAVRRFDEASRAEKKVDAARRVLQDQLKEQRQAAQKERSALRAKVEEHTRTSSSSSVPDAEYARVETRLRESGRELTALQSELERRGVLVRDLIEELADARGLPVEAAPPAPPEALEPEEATDLMSTIAWSSGEVQTVLRGQVAESAERAVVAETEKVALEFDLDEVRGELAVLEQKRDLELEEERRLEAALRGTVRGLNARLAEVTELFQQTQARLTLSADDSQTASENYNELERSLAEVREQLEMQLSRASAERAAASLAATLPPVEAAEGADFEAREAELAGALSRCREEALELGLQVRRSATEVDLANEAASKVEERVAGLRQGYEARIAEIVAELDSTGGEAERAWVQNGELKAKLGAMEQTEATRRGELLGTKFRLADREEAVAALVAQADKAKEAPSAETSSAAELDALRVELAGVREDAAGLREELAALEGAPVADSKSVVEARNAVIARLQGELAHALDRYRTLADDLSDNEVELERHREKVESARIEGAVEAEQSVRDIDAVTSKLKDSETETRSAHDALAAAKEILSGLVDGLPEAAADSPNGTRTDDLRLLRERVGQLDTQAADREVILRSLTAQLQERDDRIRALENFDPSDEEDPQALRTRTLELEERAARLTEELENERIARRRLEEGA